MATAIKMTAKRSTSLDFVFRLLGLKRARYIIANTELVKSSPADLVTGTTHLMLLKLKTECDLPPVL